MRLYLARHGNAVPAHTDDARPLSDWGRDEVDRMARFLAGAGVTVGRIVHSGKLRAEQTAEIYAARIGANAVPEKVSGIRPNDPPETIVSLIASLACDTLVAGHNPYLSSAVALLVTGQVNVPVCDLSTGAVACLEHLPGYGWQIAWIVDPALLG